MEEKVKIKLNKSKKKEAELNGIKIKVDTLISIENYETILNDIKANVFYNIEITDKVHVLDLRLIRDTLELCSNVDVESLDSEDLFSGELRDFLMENIDNFWTVSDNILKEYDRYVIENCFGILANKMPSAADMEKSVEHITKMVEELPQDKLELIGKSIVWNNAPAVGGLVAPAQHVKIENTIVEE